MSEPLIRPLSPADPFPGPDTFPAPSSWLVAWRSLDNEPELPPCLICGEPFDPAESPDGVPCLPCRSVDDVGDAGSLG